MMGLRLVGCPPNRGEDVQSPFFDILTAEERLKVHRQDHEQAESEKQSNTESKRMIKHGKHRSNKRKRSKNEKGLVVCTYDRAGRHYYLKLRFLSSNNAFRVIGPGWKKFLQKNSLLLRKCGPKRSPKQEEEGGGESPSGSSPDQDEAANGDHQAAERCAVDAVHIELWTFRSRKLPAVETGHQDGALGLVLLHHREGEDSQVALAEEDEEMDIAASNDANVAQDKGTAAVV
jgi:hypothetical protein